MKYLDLTEVPGKCKVGDIAYYTNAISIVLTDGEVTIYRDNSKIEFIESHYTDLHDEDRTANTTVWRKVKK